MKLITFCDWVLNSCNLCTLFPRKESLSVLNPVNVAASIATNKLTYKKRFLSSHGDWNTCRGVDGSKKPSFRINFMLFFHIMEALPFVFYIQLWWMLTIVPARVFVIYDRGNRNLLRITVLKKFDLVRWISKVVEYKSGCLCTYKMY